MQSHTSDTIGNAHRRGNESRTSVPLRLSAFSGSPPQLPLHIFRFPRRSRVQIRRTLSFGRRFRRASALYLGDTSRLDVGAPSPHARHLPRLFCRRLVAAPCTAGAERAPQLRGPWDQASPILWPAAQALPPTARRWGSGRVCGKGSRGSTDAARTPRTSTTFRGRPSTRSPRRARPARRSGWRVRPRAS